MAKKKKINPAEDNHWQDEMTKIFNQEPDTDNIVCNLLLLNNGISIISKALKYVFDINEGINFEGMLTRLINSSYIYSDCTRHSNMVLYVYFSWNRQYLDNALDITEAIKDTNLRYIIRSDETGRHMIIGGDWKSFIDLADMIDSDTNAIMAAICEQIYSYIPRDFAVRVSLAKKLDKDRFANIDLTELTRNYSNTVKDNLGFGTVVSYDRADALIEQVKENVLNPSLFSFTDLLEFLTMSFSINSIPYCDIEFFDNKGTKITKKDIKNIGNAYVISTDPNRRYKLKFNGTQILMSIRELALNFINSINQLADDKQTAPYTITGNTAKYLYPLGSIITNVFVTATFRDILTILLKSQDMDLGYMTDISNPLAEYFKNTLWPVEEYIDDYETYYSAIIPDSGSPFNNKIVQDQQQSIDLMDNEVAEVLSPEELERLYIQTIEMDDRGQDETKQGEE